MLLFLCSFFDVSLQTRVLYSLTILYDFSLLFSSSCASQSTTHSLHRRNTTQTLHAGPYTLNTQHTTKAIDHALCSIHWVMLLIQARASALSEALRCTVLLPMLISSSFSFT